VNFVLSFAQMAGFSSIFTVATIFFVQDHVEGYLALSGKTKTYFATAVSLWDADFYVKVDDDVHVNIGNLLVRTSRSLLIFRLQLEFWNSCLLFDNHQPFLFLHT
jgi:hypothetical protein